jgi:hypothetical protein
MTNPVQPSSFAKTRHQSGRETDHKEGHLVVGYEYAGEEPSGAEREWQQYRHHHEWRGQERDHVPADVHPPPGQPGAEVVKPHFSIDEPRHQDACDAGAGEHCQEHEREKPFCRRRSARECAGAEHHQDATP